MIAVTPQRASARARTHTHTHTQARTQARTNVGKHIQIHTKTRRHARAHIYTPARSRALTPAPDTQGQAYSDTRTEKALAKYTGIPSLNTQHLDAKTSYMMEAAAGKH